MAPRPQPAVEDSHPLRYLARYRGQVAGGVACLLVTNALALAIPWVIKWIVEGLSHPGGRSLAALVALLLGLTVAQAAIRILSRLLIFNAGREAEYDLRKTLFSRLCHLDGSFYRRFRTGDLMSRLTNDLASVRALFGAGILHIVNTLFAYAVGLPLMLRIDPLLTLLALLPYLVLLLGARAFAHGIYHRSRGMQTALASMTTSVQENLSGIRELKAHAMEAQRSEVFARSSSDYLDQALRLSFWRAGLIPFMGLGSGASLVVSLWVGGAGVIDGRMTLGDLVAFNLYLGLLAWPTMAIGWMLSMWQRGIASWHRLTEILRERSPLEDGEASPEPGDPTIEDNAKTIDICNLSVNLEEKKILDNVSFSVPAGTLCAVVGRVGSGKSTLAEALARLMDVPPGTVRVGGQDITGLPVGELRRSIAYAPQSAFLFSMSIRENILMGLGAEAVAGEPGEATSVEARIVAAVEAAGLTPDLESLPNGLDTVVGERGLSLSGGQRQRVALARALVSDRPILILDDTLSSVDAETERRILLALGGALRGRTCLLISHRLSALQHADQVVVLDEGRVMERGTHDDLLASGGLYSELYRRQVLSEL